MITEGIISFVEINLLQNAEELRRETLWSLEDLLRKASGDYNTSIRRLESRGQIDDVFFEKKIRSHIYFRRFLRKRVADARK